MELVEILEEVAREVSVCTKCDLQFSRKKSRSWRGADQCQDHVHWRGTWLL